MSELLRQQAQRVRSGRWRVELGVGGPPRVTSGGAALGDALDRIEVVRHEVSLSDRSMSLDAFAVTDRLASATSSTPGGGEVFVHHPHGHRPFAGRGSDPFDRTAADVAGSEHPAAAGLQR